MTFWDIFQESYITPNFYRLITSSFIGTFCGFFLSFQLQKRMERRTAKRNRIMHLYSLKTELELNQRALEKLEQLTTGVGDRPVSFFEMDHLKGFYSIVFALVKGLKTISYEGMLKNGMLGVLPTEEMGNSIVNTYSEIENVIFESESSFAWLEQSANESPTEWFNRKKGIVSFLHSRVEKAMEQVMTCVDQVKEEMKSQKT